MRGPRTGNQFENRLRDVLASGPAGQGEREGSGTGRFGSVLFGLRGEGDLLLRFDQERIARLSGQQGVADAPVLGGDVQETLLPQAAHLLSALMAHQVRRAALFVRDFARRRDFEPFLHPLVGFQLRHDHAFLNRSVAARATRRSVRPL